MSLTLADTLALAVLRGDRVAAYVLADRLIEEANESQQSRAEQELAAGNAQMAFDGRTVYQWPEFQAFARRLGFRYDLRSRSAVITIREGELVTIQHEYVGADVPASLPEVAIDTTSLQNQTYRTYHLRHTGGLPG